MLQSLIYLLEWLFSVRWLHVKESACQCRRCRFDPWVGMIPWRRKWQLTPVFLPGKYHGERSLAGSSPWGCKESDTTEQLNNNNNSALKQTNKQNSCSCICNMNCLNVHHRMKLQPDPNKRRGGISALAFDKSRFEFALYFGDLTPSLLLCLS